MVKKPVLLFLALILAFPLTCLFGAQIPEDDFETLDWTLPFPDVILKDAAASIKIGTGLFFNPAGDNSLVGLYAQFRPTLHFLIFDGTFNVGLRTYFQDQDFFIDLANDRTEDYYQSVRVKIKRATFAYAEAAESFGEYLYHPTTYPNEKNLKLQWDNQNWHISTLSPNWKDWSFAFKTPEIGWSSVGFGADIQGFYEATPTNSFAISAGPKIRLLFLDIVPFIGYKVQGVSEIEGIDPFSRLTFGLKTDFRYSPFSIKAGFQLSEIPEYYCAVGLGPLLLSFGQKSSFSRPSGKDVWQQIQWSWQEKGVETKVGFGQINQAYYVFSDIDLRVNDRWSLRASVKSGIGRILPLATPVLGSEGLSFSVGVEYTIPIKMSE
ncbi:MAG TPA: hypothetical protein PKM99_02890 [Thermotogota bacterium]|jgi:hypothetical protein|nr:hypothetical protein [Thermotogota bacterium]NLZ13039.1 hypothetical protein [Thermotogaceae bacterium]MDD8040162.1 hypothetical protein [Thermotogota bacterium]MDD8052857.1 hypothetical protein [Thermotogota bacterium]HNR62960.1 hypothetical protein [Thermotogota bacterium]